MKEKLKKHKVWIVSGVLVILAAIVITIVVMNLRENQTSQGQETKRQSTISLEKMDLTKSVSATGTIQSKESKTVSAEVNGVRITEVKKVVGDTVEKGDVLVSFDESDLQEALTEAKENLSDTTNEADRNISSAKKQLSDAKETYNEEKEKAAEEIKKAKEELAAAKSQVSSLEKQISAEKNAETKAKLEEQLFLYGFY